MSKFKTFTKTHEDMITTGAFWNGQKVFTVYAGYYPDGTLMIQVEDGAGHLMKEWEDFEESD